MSSLEKTILTNKLPPLPTGFGGRRGSGSYIHKRHEYTPISWNKYWDKKNIINIGDNDKFCTYHKGTSGPLLLLLHGGGYSALTWSLFAESVTSMVECQVMAFDQRGHGDTYTIEDTDLCAEKLAKDVGDILYECYGENRPPCILIGHSMGGAIAVHAAHDGYVHGLAGLVVIDVVEGTAMDALSSMQSFLRGRPQNFATIQNAIEWSIRSGQTRNAESARVSMPGQVRSLKSNKCATCDVKDEIVGETSSDCATFKKPAPVDTTADSIPEENEEQEGSSERVLQQINANNYTWRIDLGKTEKFWEGWFKNLSRRFLDSSPTKMLLLAGIDRLDTNLTVGQMQGKFQMQVLPQCGHAVHEDVPDRVAEVVANFLIRHKLSSPLGDFNRPFPAC